MKQTAKNTFRSLIILAMMGFFATGCVEGRYYHQYNHHTRGWYERRHVPPPAGVDFSLDIHN